MFNLFLQIDKKKTYELEINLKQYKLIKHKLIKTINYKMSQLLTSKTLLYQWYSML